MPLVMSTKKNRKLKEPTKKQLTFIVEKFVKKGKIIWARDIACAKNLWRMFPHFNFWSILPADFQMDALVGFLTNKALTFLKLEYAKFNLQLPVQEPIILEDAPLVQPQHLPPSKPNSIFEFCK